MGMELQTVLAQQEQCAPQGDTIEATCRTEWNQQIEETRAHFEEQKEIVREERDLELENTRQAMDAELARVREEYTTQYEAIQQSREQQLMRLTEEREAECAAAGFEEECTDRFNDQIEAERVRMEQSPRPCGRRPWTSRGCRLMLLSTGCRPSATPPAPTRPPATR